MMYLSSHPYYMLIWLLSNPGPGSRQGISSSTHISPPKRARIDEPLEKSLLANRWWWRWRENTFNVFLRINSCVHTCPSMCHNFRSSAYRKLGRTVLAKFITFKGHRFSVLTNRGYTGHIVLIIRDGSKLKMTCIAPPNDARWAREGGRVQPHMAPLSVIYGHISMP